jgi:hypothetical protein
MLSSNPTLIEQDVARHADEVCTVEQTVIVLLGGLEGVTEDEVIRSWHHFREPNMISHNGTAICHLPGSIFMYESKCQARTAPSVRKSRPL